MPSLTRRLSLVFPILFYLLALFSLWLHLPTGDTALLLVALVAGVVSIGGGVALVLHQHNAVGRLSSGA